MRVLLGEMSQREPWWAEFWAACAAVVWVTWAWLFTWGIIYVPSFRIVTDLVPEYVWYATGLAGGLAQIIALRHNYTKVRWWLCMFMAAWWGFLFLAVAQADTIPSPGLSLYLIFALINHYSIYRLRVDG